MIMKQRFSWISRMVGLSLLLSGGLLYVGEPASVSASDTTKLTVASAVTYKTPTVQVNGSQLLLKESPYLIKGRVMVPLRGVAEGFGASVKWDKATLTATVARGAHQAHMTAGSSTAIRDGIPVTLDASVELRNGRIYIPLRFSAESMGGAVSWKASTATASIVMPLTPADAESVIGSTAEVAVTALRDRDWGSLMALSSAKGVRFSPYGYIDTKNDRVLSKSALITAPLDDTAIVWGSYDGSGFPILLNFAQYYDRFIYSSDFAAAPQIGYNTNIGKGNTLNNSLQVYPNAIVVEYHYAGFDPQYAGMDWQSLRLVFEKEGSQWLLVGIIHDEWTI